MAAVGEDPCNCVAISRSSKSYGVARWHKLFRDIEHWVSHPIPPNHSHSTSLCHHLVQLCGHGVFLVCSKEGIKINAEAKDVNTNEGTSQLKQHCNVLMVR